MRSHRKNSTNSISDRRIHPTRLHIDRDLSYCEGYPTYTKLRKQHKTSAVSDRNQGYLSETQMLRVSIMIFQYVILMLALIEGNAFLAPASHTIRSVKLHATDQDGNEGMIEGLVAAGSSLQSQLASAFSNLDESDQYDAVLTGLCAKILDQPSLSGDDVIVALEDPISLLEEMNARRVSAGSRSLMALVDVSFHCLSVTVPSSMLRQRFSHVLQMFTTTLFPF